MKIGWFQKKYLAPSLNYRQVVEQKIDRAQTFLNRTNKIILNARLRSIHQLSILYYTHVYVT